MPASRTRQEEVYRLLRADILSGRVQPGERLAFAALCDRFSVSVGAVREALQRLAEQSLVRSEPQRGFVVMPLSEADLRDLTEARVHIETLTLRQAIRDGDLDWEGRLVAVHHRLAVTPVYAPGHPDRLSEAWAEVHNEFHGVLLAGCRNPRLTEIANHLRASAELYRRWSVPLSDRTHPRDIPAEHAAIVDAVLARDAELASRRLAEHIETTTRLLLESGRLSV
ncbi:MULTISPECIES: GntR family transcriptional regulator [unclassified Microbacterium]|nr:MULTISPECIES: GntR family transcriptional regulator [unclassified Microbacterium]PRB69159.1 GntR family transcriptional regulator [Microbacterium sp. MYb32]PQZ53499.1 GntR family transcriptional regulator [Microbacterium sp. MYb43]PQZ75102.1 GntR family transcriptional regulator [Microbacterium sp. MYb40]PRB19396.1 GntR family transcriptional regulator [Microbacterium sp. MYb54]PRB24597.1 GntR family transcriptional regulator [Microbacterium sp. MYb50]